MKFLGDISKKMTQAGQVTMQKTKEVTDVVKINAQLAQSESQLNKVYQDIGKQYVILHKADYENEFSVLMQVALELQQQITELKIQLNVRKGTFECQNCGAEVPRESAFCHNCGLAVSVSMQQVTDGVEEKVMCPHCGGTVRKNVRFCTTCGKPIIIAER